MKRLAVIDCGTNTFNLLIIDRKSQTDYELVFQTRQSVKLGEHSTNGGYLSENAFKRGLEAIEHFKKNCTEHQTKVILAFATAAIRDALNGKEFVNEVLKQFDISIQIIDGNREAELIYKGVIKAVKMQNESSLIMDIGGGSNEYILANKNEMLWKGSFNIGAARILERFVFSDPAKEIEIQNVKNYLIEELQPLLMAVKEFKPTELIGASGAFDSFLEMIHHELDGEAPRENKTEYGLNYENYQNISNRIKHSTLEQRKCFQGLVPMRVDMIVISSIMIDMILETCNLKKIRVSAYALKEGALFDFLTK